MIVSRPLAVIGTPFSTFTRTITLALHYKGLPFNQVHVLPHSDTAYEHHPFGFLPTLVIHEIEGKVVDLKLRESMAIARYLDRLAPQPSLCVSVSDRSVLVVEEQMWEFVSFVAAHGDQSSFVQFRPYLIPQCLGFPAVEKGVVKPRVALTDEGKLSGAEVRQEISGGIEKLLKFLTVIESTMSPGGYVFGEELSWADVFLYPLLADLNATPERDLLSVRLRMWMDLMGNLDAVKATTAGTLSVGARP